MSRAHLPVGVQHHDQGVRIGGRPPRRAHARAVVAVAEAAAVERIPNKQS